MSDRLASKVLLVGWDAADWKLINPLLDQGLMPAFETLVDEGVVGNIATLQPVLSPMLWNSIATGKRADKHGVLGFIEPDPQTGGVRPVSSTSRKVKAVWNILNQRGLRPHVVGWLAGHPAEPIDGVFVSDLFPYASAPINQPWALPSGAVHPEELRDSLGELRMHPAEVTPAAILPFIPRAAEIDQERDKNLVSFAKTLAENCSIHNVATWILENEPWDFLAVYYNGIDHFCHGFMHFHPPHLEGIAEDQFQIYKDVINGAYRFHDMLLARLLQLAGPDTTVILVSDHGFHSDHLRPRKIPDELAGAAVQHRPFGVICMRGPHIKRDERIYGSTLLDITPTILTLFGLPVGQDMDGRVLVEAFEQPPEVGRIPSWETEPGECGMHPAELRIEPEAAQAILQQLVALGYIQPPEEKQAKNVEIAVQELKYNLARVYLDSRRPSKALPLLQELASQHPEEIRFAEYLAQTHLLLGHLREAREVLEVRFPRDKNQPWADWMRGVIAFEEGQVEEALTCILCAEQANPLLPTLHVRIGETYLRKCKLSDAERAFLKALEIDGDSPEARLGLAIVRLRQRKNPEAVEEALLAVSLQHFFPLGHYYLGVALSRLGHMHRATLAFETALSMMPGLLPAHRWLAALYSRPAGDITKASEHRRLFNELRLQKQARTVQ